MKPLPHWFLSPVSAAAARPVKSCAMRSALCALAGNLARIDSHTEKNWASVTFAGTRHRIVLVFDGAEAADAGEHFIDALPDHEFTIPRQLVADASVVEVDHTIAPATRMVVTCEVLMLEEA